MSDKDQKIDDALKMANPNKRAFLKALAVGAGFAAPMLASFKMKGVAQYTVHAQVASNVTTFAN